jgi:hypothetical protein
MPDPVRIPRPVPLLLHVEYKDGKPISVSMCDDAGAVNYEALRNVELRITDSASIEKILNPEHPASLYRYRTGELTVGYAGPLLRTPPPRKAEDGPHLLTAQSGEQAWCRGLGHCPFCERERTA